MPPTSMPVRDAAGNLLDVAQEISNGVRTPRSAPEVAGQAISATNPMPVSSGGSTGRDHSANGAVPSGTPLLTIPVNPARLAVELQNQSAADLTLVRDDGAGGNLTSIILATGGAVGAQGGGWASSTFRGRIRVYGPAGSRVSASED